MQFILMFLFQHDQVFTRTELTKYTDQVSEKTWDKSGFFWTKHQMDLKKNPKRVFFTSEFGTGKTLLLKTKAKEIAEHKEKIYFILFTASDSILAEGIKQEFEENETTKKYIEVKFLSGKG
jgi:hypothetical protein